MPQLKWRSNRTIVVTNVVWKFRSKARVQLDYKLQVTVKQYDIMLHNKNSIYIAREDLKLTRNYRTKNTLKHLSTAIAAVENKARHHNVSSWRTFVADNFDMSTIYRVVWRPSCTLGSSLPSQPLHSATLSLLSSVGSWEMSRGWEQSLRNDPSRDPEWPRDPVKP